MFVLIFGKLGIRHADTLDRAVVDSRKEQEICFADCSRQGLKPAHPSVKLAPESVPTNGGKRRYNLPASGRPGVGSELDYVAKVVLLGSRRFNYKVIFRVDCTCGQRPSCIRRCLLSSLLLPLPAPPFGGPEKIQK